uniref:Scaffold protein ILK n=1 Tax=Pavo cristatus TaxID=9049 RepID=A0A8C9LFL8_PAVCR
MDDIFTQCREGNAVAVRLWLDNTENDLNQGDDHGFSPLHWACREGRSNVVDMLIMRGARINVMNRGDDTPLHLAASHGHRDIVQKLIQFKADINAVNEHGNTPLHYACFWGHDTVAEDLVGNGALVSIANKYSETPIDKAKMPLREILKERAEKLGQNLTKIPYKDTFWKGTTRTRPRNGTLNKLAGIDFKQLSLSQKLNENQSGELWKGRWQGNDIVIKMLKIRDWTTRKSRDFNEEYPKLRIFSHPNVLPVLGACQSPPAPHPIVISHWMPYGSLYNVLHEGTNFVVDQMQAVKFAFDIARGMAFLHTLEPLIPRHHLNSRSIMIDEDMTARISMADVKFSFQCPGRMYAPAWVAPEALQKKPEEINRRSADMWSFAVLLWELVTREVPFADLSNMEIGMKVALEGLRPTIPPGISPHICKLMKICMNEDPAKRPKFDMIVPILEKICHTAPRTFLLRNERRAMEKKVERKVGHFCLHIAYIPATARGRPSPPGDAAAAPLPHSWQPSPSVGAGRAELRGPNDAASLTAGTWAGNRGSFHQRKTTQWFNGAEANPKKVPSSNPPLT